MDKVFECVFVDEFFGDVGDFDADIFWLVQGGVEVEIFEIKGCKVSPALGSLTSSSEPVGVPTSPGYAMLLPPMLM